MLTNIIPMITDILDNYLNTVVKMLLFGNVVLRHLIELVQMNKRTSHT